MAFSKRFIAKAFFNGVHWNSEECQQHLAELKTRIQELNQKPNTPQPSRLWRWLRYLLYKLRRFF